MITKLTNFIGNKKVIAGIIFVIIIFVIGYNVFFSTTKKEFDTDGDGKIDKVEYYNRGVKVREMIDYNYSDPKCKIIIYWNREGDINRLDMLLFDPKSSHRKIISRYSKGIKVSKSEKEFIKQKKVEMKAFSEEEGYKKAEWRGNSYIYSKDRKVSFMELDEKNNEVINKVILFDQNGRTAQTKEDKDSNGKFEYYEFYEHGKKTAVGYDYDEDGEIDKKEEVKNKQKE